MKGIREQLEEKIKTWDIERLREEMLEVIESLPVEMLIDAFQDELELDDEEE